MKSKSPIWVIKIGSSLLTDLRSGLNVDLIGNLVSQIKFLSDENVQIVLVSSGAVAVGMTALNWSNKPKELHLKQAAAALGQVKLAQLYESNCAQVGLHSALILLTETDFADRVRYLNARTTLQTLLKLKVVPIINENDSIVNDEIRLGDNDTLAALVCNLLDADKLVLLTDQDGLYDSDPRVNSNAIKIKTCFAEDKRLLDYAGKSGELGTGGMFTKVIAAQKAARSGTNTVICNGKITDILINIWRGKQIGTLLKPSGETYAARKRWLADRLKIMGKLTLDDGAVKSIQSFGRSLLPVGVISSSGKFQRGDLVVCIDVNGKEVARGLVNYNYNHTKKIIRLPSDQIGVTLGFSDGPELIHRDNMVLIDD